MASSSGRSYTLFKCMNNLRSHLVTCRHCKGAVKTLNSVNMCPMGLGLTVAAASEFDTYMEMRRAAVKRADGVVYACPEPVAHGQAYAALAEPCYMVGVQKKMI